MAEPPTDIFGLVGTILDGQYRVDAVVGQGGYGVVYRGFHLTFEQPVAIKVLKLSENDPAIQSAILGKFREEAKLQYVLSQASLNVVRSIGFGALNTPAGVWAPFVVLEWLDGLSLAADLDERRQRGNPARTMAEALAILEPAARGLIAAHHQRVAHRDVKPANFFLTHTSDVPAVPTTKVLDFGIAKVILGDDLTARPTAFMSFTPIYASPEQLDTRLGATGLHTDVYSFALVFVEVLTGRPPVDGREVMQILREATDPARRPTPRARGALVPDAVEAVFARALSVEPRARHADLEQMWDALTKALASSRPAATLEIPSSKARGAVRGMTKAMPSSGVVPLAAAETAAAQTAGLVANPHARASWPSHAPGGPPLGTQIAAAPAAPVPQAPAPPPWTPPATQPPYVWGPPPASLTAQSRPPPAMHPAPTVQHGEGVHWGVWVGIGLGALVFGLILLSWLLHL